MAMWKILYGLALVGALVAAGMALWGGYQVRWGIGPQPDAWMTLTSAGWLGGVSLVLAVVARVVQLLERIAAKQG